MRQAIILAAGEGQRLRPFTFTRPKVMLSIAGKPILQYVIEALAQVGIRRIVIVVGYRKEQIFDHFGEGEGLNVEISYVTQDKQLGTAHALSQAKSKVDNEFIVLGGDNLIDAGTIAEFANAEPPAVLIKQVQDASRYGVVTVADGHVRQIVEKPAGVLGDRVNTGIYAFDRSIFDEIGSDLQIPDVVNAMRETSRVNAVETQGTWLDAVYPWDIIRLNAAVLEHTPPRLGGTIEAGATLKGAVSVGKDTVIRSNSYIVGPVVIGRNCEIGPNVCVLPSTSVGDNVSIAPFSTIENSIIGDDVSIGPACIVEDSVVDKGCVVRGHFTASSGQADVRVDEEHHEVNVGAMIGISCSVGSNVIAEPGTILGNYSEVQSMRVLRGSFPDRSRVF